MVNPFHFDYTYFQKILADATSTAFTALAEQHKDEEIYAFGLEAHTQFESLFPFILTEEKLTNDVLDWLTSPYLSKYQEFSEQEIQSYLRYGVSPERDYHLAEKYFSKLHHMQGKDLRRFDGLIISARKELPENEVHALTIKHENDFRDTCIAALQKLDRQGTFGKGDQRNNIVLMLYFTGYGSLDGETLEHVKALNPETVVKRYEAEIAEAKRIRSIMDKL